jgi:hypothetical protein
MNYKAQTLTQTPDTTRTPVQHRTRLIREVFVLHSKCKRTIFLISETKRLDLDAKSKKKIGNADYRV